MSIPQLLCRIRPLLNRTRREFNPAESIGNRPT